MNFNLDRNSSFFNSHRAAVDFLIENNIIIRSINCRICNNRSNLKIIEKEGERLLYYKCNTKTCKTKINFNSKTVLKGTKLKYHDLFFFRYCYVLDLRVNAIFNLTGISQTSYILFKNKIDVCLRMLNEEDNEPLGGLFRNVQVDEMCIRRGELVSNPSQMVHGLNDNIDDDADHVWIVGGVEEAIEESNSLKPRFFIEIVPNRRAHTIKNLFYNKIKPDTTIITDGLATYPAAIQQANDERGMNYIHLSVNHSEEFVTETGIHTNDIENMWSHVRSMWRERHGVSRENINNFLNDFRFIKRNIKRECRESVKNAWFTLIKKIFTIIN